MLQGSLQCTPQAAPADPISLRPRPRACWRAACLLALALVHSALQADPKAARQTFQNLWPQARAGQDVSARIAALGDYPLAPYLEAAQLSHQPKISKPAAVLAFVQREQGTYIGEQLRKQFLDHYARSLQHAHFLALMDPAETDLGRRCQAYLARRAIEGKGDPDTALALWTAAVPSASACAPLFRELHRQGLIDDGAVAARIREAVRAEHLGTARALLPLLGGQRRLAAERFILARADPLAALTASARWPKDDAHRDALSLALQRAARKDPPAIATRYRQLAAGWAFEPAAQHAIEAEIARWAAVSYLPQAAEWLAALPAAAFDDNLREWQARYAIRRLDYSGARAAIMAMSESTRSQPRWRYAAARLGELQPGGSLESVRADYAALAGEAHFHGFLAADRIDAPYAICAEASLLRDAAALRVLALPGIRRASEWMALGETGRARAEWFWQLGRLSAEERREAGLIAAREGWHEWAIFTLNEGALMRLYEARFPILEQTVVEREARRTGLEAAWVLGLIRAESAWNPQARSAVGARGLMQLMPATAAAVARSLKTRAEPLNDPAHNIRLGTTYLSRRLAELDGNAVLATGSYNAGVGAVRRWLKEPLPPWDLWVETVPFRETREYIARVLAFATLYGWRIDGSPERLGRLIPDFPVSPGPAPIACPEPKSMETSP